MTFERLKALREDHDLTQQQVADILHCSQVTYYYYESGKREVPIHAFIRLASYYGCSIDYLTNCTNEKKRYPEG